MYFYNNTEVNSSSNIFQKPASFLYKNATW